MAPIKIARRSQGGTREGATAGVGGRLGRVTDVSFGGADNAASL